MKHCLTGRLHRMISALIKRGVGVCKSQEGRDVDSRCASWMCSRDQDPGLWHAPVSRAGWKRRAQRFYFVFKVGPNQGQWGFYGQLEFDLAAAGIRWQTGLTLFCLPSHCLGLFLCWHFFSAHSWRSWDKGRWVIQVVFIAGLVKKEVKEEEEEYNKAITHSTWQLRPKDMLPTVRKWKGMSHPSCSSHCSLEWQC